MERVDSLVYGEIVSAYPPGSPENLSNQRWEYAVKCILPNGHKHTFQHAVFMEQFSGLTDYSQRVVRTSGHFTTRAYQTGLSDKESDATIGDRCVVAFLGGLLTVPVIMGMLPHPASPSVIVAPESKFGYDNTFDPDTVYPSIRTRFNGVEIKIDEMGDFSISRTGLPEIKQNDPFTPIKVRFPGEDEFVGITFGKKGRLSLTTNKKQQMLFDTEHEAITISDPSHYMQFNAKEEIFVLIAQGTYENIIGKDRKIDIEGSDELRIGKNSTSAIEGKVEFTIDKTLTGEIKEKMEIKTSNSTSLTSGDNFTLKTDKDFTVNASGQTKIEMSSGKIAIGNSSVELIDIVTQALNILSTTTAAGYGAPISSVSQFAQLYAKLLPMKK